MNDIDKMPVKCRDCAYWELATFPWCCGDCKDRLKKPVSDFVSRQWLIDEYHRRHEGSPGCALKMIEDAPAADVEPKRKSGWWIDVNPASISDPRMRCSVCGGIELPRINWRFCPKCGAKTLLKPKEEDDD